MSKALDDAKVGWQSDRLEITSPSLSTRARDTDPSDGGSSSSTHSDNRYLHEWFRRCVDQGLADVRKRHLVSQIEVSFGREL